MKKFGGAVLECGAKGYPSFKLTSPPCPAMTGVLPRRGSVSLSTPPSAWPRSRDRRSHPTGLPEPASASALPLPGAGVGAGFLVLEATRMIAEWVGRSRRAPWTNGHHVHPVHRQWPRRAAEGARVYRDRHVGRGRRCHGHGLRDRSGRQSAVPELGGTAIVSISSTILALVSCFFVILAGVSTTACVAPPASAAASPSSSMVAGSGPLQPCAASWTRRRVLMSC